MIGNISMVALLVTALLAVAVRYVWYSPLMFGPQWSKRVGVFLDSEIDLHKGAYIKIAIALAIQYIYFYVLATLMLTVQSVSTFLFVGGSVSVLVALQILHIAMWEKRDFTYVLLTIGYIVFTTFGGLGVIIFWPW